MSEEELENKMKQILDDYAPILNVTPPNEELPKPKKQKAQGKKQKGTKLQTSKLATVPGNEKKQSILVKL
jgi:hypothetical protein